MANAPRRETVGSAGFAGTRSPVSGRPAFRSRSTRSACGTRSTAWTTNALMNTQAP